MAEPGRGDLLRQLEQFLRLLSSCFLIFFARVKPALICRHKSIVIDREGRGNPFDVKVFPAGASLHFIGQQEGQKLACLGSARAVCPDCRKHIYLSVDPSLPIWEWQKRNVYAGGERVLDKSFE